ncbi:hypothetical protein BDC45DRAFT_44068 [Circinella umbellata]|nr:hypothetical protein BDC45DRAFT_44068 [Circinella umbellata]
MQQQKMSSLSLSPTKTIAVTHNKIINTKENIEAQSIWHNIPSSTPSSSRDNLSSISIQHHQFKTRIIPEDHAHSIQDNINTPKVTQTYHHDIDSFSDKTTQQKQIHSSSSSSAIISKGVTPTDKQISSSNKQYIFSQKTNIAEATMLEFELDYNERYSL